MTTPLAVSFDTITTGPIAFPGIFSGWGVRYNEVLRVSIDADFVLGRDPTIGRWRKTFRAGSRGDAVGYNGSFAFPYNGLFAFGYGPAVGSSSDSESVAQIVTTAPTISLADDGMGNSYPYISGGVRRDYRVWSLAYQLAGLNRHGIRILVPLPELPAGWDATMDPAPTHLDLFTGRFISTDVSDLNPDKTTDFPHFLVVGRDNDNPDTSARFRHGGGPDGRRLVNAFRPDSSYHSLLIDPVTGERFIVPTCRFYQSEGFAVWREPYRTTLTGTARTWWPGSGATEVRLMSAPYRNTSAPVVLASAPLSISTTSGTGAGASSVCSFGSVDYDFSAVTIPGDCGNLYVEMVGDGAGYPFTDLGRLGYYLTPPPPPGFSCDDVPGSEMCLGPLLRYTP